MTTTQDTPQQKRVLRTSRAAKRTRQVFPAGTRVRRRVGGQLGTVERHVPGANAQGGYLVVRWDANDHVGRVGPITVERVERVTQSLTPGQQRILDDVQDGPRTYNGRARRPIEALVSAGLVTADFDSIPQVKGNGIELVQRITVTATNTTEHTMSNFTSSYSHAAPFIRQQAVYAAAAEASSRTIKSRQQARARLEAIVLCLEILLGSPEGKASPGGIADEESLPTNGLDLLRGFLVGYPDAEILFPTVEIPAGITK